MNEVDPTGSIKFTHEEEENNSLAFLDTLLVRQPNGSVKVKVYRKKTHTNQYLNFNSHHPLPHKLGVVRTLVDRAHNLVTEEDDKKEELATITKALTVCGYPQWTMTSVQKKRDSGKKERAREDREKSRGMIVLPYVRGTSEKLKRVLRKRRIATAMRPHTTLRRLLVSPKDKLEPGDGVYSIDCKNCEGRYIGETKRKLKVRVKEHREEAEKISGGMRFTRGSKKLSEKERWSSAITDHIVHKNHVMNWDSAKLRQRESDWKNAVYFYVEAL